MGDPSGIGPEVALKAIRAFKGKAEFVLIGDAGALQRSHKSQVTSHKVRHALELIDLKNVSKNNFSFGKVRAEYGRASFEYLEKALELIRAKRVDALVTCPISKEAWHKAGIRFFGHTEYLAQRFGVKDTVMMLVNQGLRFSLVTKHIALNLVSKHLTQPLICATVAKSYEALQSIFGVRNPRIVVCGLNPHASDNGIIGKEEARCIAPALTRLAKKFPRVAGPLPADSAISLAAHGDYDCVVAMYHDQALIPLKLFGNTTGVNLTIGLPFIRTSPLHGTAFDIAGKKRACADSLLAAIELTCQCASRPKKD
jgi:4-hydroxythreonine-4-phosphate dehydrogenase